MRRLPVLLRRLEALPPPSMGCYGPLFPEFRGPTFPLLWQSVVSPHHTSPCVPTRFPRCQSAVVTPTPGRWALCVDHRRIRLEAGSGDPKRLGLTAKVFPLWRLDSQVLPQSVPPLERIAGPRHSFRSQLCREHGGSDCGRRRAALPHRKLSDPRYTKWNTGGDRDGDSVRHRLAVQSEDHASPTGRADGCEHSLVPTLQRNLLRKATEHLVGRCDRRDHCPSVCLVTAGHSQHAGNHVTRMARSSGSVGVVTVEIPNKNSICEGR